MPNETYINTHDWSKDLQPYIDRLYGLDGKRESLSEEDIQIAQGSYCKDTYNNSSSRQDVSKIVCNDRSKAKLFSERAKSLYDLRSQFSSDNPVHIHLKLDSNIIDDPNKIEKSYNLLEKILMRVKNYLHKHKKTRAQQKLDFVYRSMHKFGVELVKEANQLFAVNLCEKNANCEGSSFVVNAVAHEFGWPVHFVTITNHVCKHVFVRWQDNEIRFNIERGAGHGHIRTDGFYEKKCKIKKETLNQKTPYLALMYHTQGLARLEQGKYEYAIKDFDLAIENDPEFSPAYMNRGYAYVKMNRYREAMQDFDKAIELNPELAEAYYNRGQVKLAIHKYEDAIKDFNEVIGLIPKFAEAYNKRGLAKQALKMFADAVKDFKDTISLNPKHANARYNLAMIYFYDLMYPKIACDYIKKACELDPYNQQYSKLLSTMRCDI